MVSAVDPKNQTDGRNKLAGQTMIFTTDSDAPKSKRVAYIGSSNVELTTSPCTERSMSVTSSGRSSMSSITR